MYANFSPKEGFASKVKQFAPQAEVVVGYKCSMTVETDEGVFGYDGGTIYMGSASGTALVPK